MHVCASLVQGMKHIAFACRGLANVRKTESQHCPLPFSTCIISNVLYSPMPQQHPLSACYLHLIPAEACWPGHVCSDRCLAAIASSSANIFGCQVCTSCLCLVQSAWALQYAGILLTSSRSLGRCAARVCSASLCSGEFIHLLLLLPISALPWSCNQV